MNATSLFGRLNAYQRERFPVLLVIGSLLLPILSSAAVVGGFDPGIIAVCLAVSFLYLVVIRISDEFRDYEHDRAFHPERPLSAGVVTKSELKTVGITAGALFVIFSAAAGVMSLIGAGVLLAYTYGASKEFFIAHRIRPRFFIYNAANLVQMILMQVFVYLILGSLVPTGLILAHLLFTTAGTLTFELVRKLKRPGEDGAGRDTYTWHLGFGVALVAYAALSLLTALMFSLISSFMGGAPYLLIALGVVIVTWSAAWQHYRMRSGKSEILLQATYAGMYGLCNASIVYAFL